jgi:hypothetical protein
MGDIKQTNKGEAIPFLFLVFRVHLDHGVRFGDVVSGCGWQHDILHLGRRTDK